MNKRKYYYIVDSNDGVNRRTTFEYAENKFEAEKKARKNHLKLFGSHPFDVESFKLTKQICCNLFGKDMVNIYVKTI